ncbi:unnamed protein product [Bursaphelenchus xylophilus]|uniref:(pine wood nematode) hypothetical protein n=1 Tax=Bursaphelenchus xylophilus TaxID=6326 RepID=A0A1I7RNY7_BURXY|nr:unnamed protein product [Bursaphelenchus xylophilus]CAG9124392.1 unnamed protein product [Bursaphelenchus xylophilus]
MDYFRGWIAITMIQQIGILARIAVDSESLQSAFFKSATSRRAARPYVTLFMAFTVQQLIVKMALQVEIKSRTLNFIHAAFSLIVVVFFILETFLYEYYEITNSTIIQLVFNLISVIFTAVMWPKLRQDQPHTEEHRPRKLIAKHFMETQVKGLSSDAENIRLELKKQK